MNEVKKKAKALSDDDLENVGGGYYRGVVFERYGDRFVGRTATKFNDSEAKKLKEKGFDIIPNKRYTNSELREILGVDNVEFTLRDLGLKRQSRS